MRKDEGKQIARDLEQRLYEGDLKAASGDIKKVANRQNPVGGKNPNRDKYLAAADEHLKTKGIHQDERYDKSKVEE